MVATLLEYLPAGIPLFVFLALLHDSWRNTQLNAISSEIKAGDDTSLYRLFGFSLFAAIHHRKKSIFGHLPNTTHFLQEPSCLEN